MQSAKAVQIYQNSKINTATAPELTLMLYEGAIKFCNRALEGLKEKNIAKTHNNIIKVEKIIIEFRATLDFQYKVAQDFDRVYDYLYRRLVEANLKKEKEILEEVNDYLHDMRDTWKEAMKSA